MSATTHNTRFSGIKQENNDRLGFELTSSNQQIIRPLNHIFEYFDGDRQRYKAKYNTALR